MTVGVTQYTYILSRVVGGGDNEQCCHHNKNEWCGLGHHVLQYNWRREQLNLSEQGLLMQILLTCLDLFFNSRRACKQAIVDLQYMQPDTAISMHMHKQRSGFTLIILYY